MECTVDLVVTERPFPFPTAASCSGPGSMLFHEHFENLTPSQNMAQQPSRNANADTAYIAYVRDKGYPPTNPTHLMKYCKIQQIPITGVNWSAAKKVISNPPSIPPSDTSVSSVVVTDDTEHEMKTNTNVVSSDPTSEVKTDSIMALCTALATDQDNNALRQRGGSVSALKEKLLTLSLNLEQKPTVHNVKEFKSGDPNAKPFKTVFKVLQELEDLDEKYELEPQSNTASLVEVDIAFRKGMNDFLDGMAITHKVNLTTSGKLLYEETINEDEKEKESSSVLVVHDDRFNMNVSVLSPDPVVSLSVDQEFSEWSQEMQDQFVCDIAEYLDINPIHLVPICVSNGSIQFFLQIANILDEKFPEIKKKITSIANNLKICEKLKLKMTQIPTFFSKPFTKSKQNQEKVPTENVEMTELSSAEKWLLNKAEKLRKGITASLQQCSDEFEVSAICALDNPDALQEFVQIEGWKESKLLFHGTKLCNLPSIFEGGFSDDYIAKNTGNCGWYGRGHYFTSFPEYSMKYIADGNNPTGQYTLIVAYVNLGKTREVYSKESYYEKYIEAPYQSHYTRTEGCYAVPKEQWGRDDLYDEYVVCTGKRVLPRFYVTFTVKRKVLVWRDKKLSNAQNSGILDKLRKSHVVYGATSSESALRIIKKKKEKNHVYVITNGADESEKFIQNIRNELKVTQPIFIFSATRHQWGHIYEKYENVDYTSGIHEFVEKHLL